MSLLFVAIASMLLALTCYTIGVWGEYLARKLSPWHVAFFWMGLFFDSTLNSYDVPACPSGAGLVAA